MSGESEHECNDCGILTEKYRPICTLCERWYEEHDLPLPDPPAQPSSVPGEPHV